MVADLVYSHSAGRPVLAVPVPVLVVDQPRSVAAAAGLVSAVRRLLPGRVVVVVVVLAPAAEAAVCWRSTSYDDADSPAAWWSAFAAPG